jgi:flagellar biosynthetic protein FlhB
MGDDSGEKTEEPTPHKLEEARKKGQVSKSKDFTAAVVLMVSYFSLKIFAPFILVNLQAIVAVSFTHIPHEFNSSIAMMILKQALILFSFSILPLFAVNFFTALIVEYLQVGAVFSFEPLSPSLDKINPIEGFKKLVSMKQFVELFKSILKMAVVGYIIYAVLKDEFIYVLIAQELTILQTVAIASSLMFKIVARVCTVYLIIAIMDLFYQRYEYMKGLKMSKKEIKDEYKQLEGDPLVKQRQRDVQREMASGRQMGSVPDSDVIVTNPTHYAVAIQYVPNQMQAPKVIAKGQRLIALQIKQIAEKHFIPIIENPPMARALYETPVGADVPQEYYKAVAEILAFVYNLKKKKKKKRF